MATHQFKDDYSYLWQNGNRREKLVYLMLERLGLNPHYKGFGAGSTEYIEGWGEENGKQQNESDLTVEGENIEIEVTGTDIPSVSPTDEVWIQRGKFQYAYENPDTEHWAIHVLDGPGVVRAVELTPDRCEKYRNSTTTRATRHSAHEKMEPLDPFGADITPIKTFLKRMAPNDLSDEQANDVLNYARAHWITRDNIITFEDRVQYAALRFADDPSVTRDATGPVTVSFTDSESNTVPVTIPATSDLTAYEWETGEWYFLSNMRGDDGNDTTGLVVTGNTGVTAFNPLDFL